MKRNEVDGNNSFFGGFEAVVDGLSRPGGVKKPGSSKNPDEDSFETVVEIGDKEKEYPLIDPFTGEEVEDESEFNDIKDTDNGLQNKEKREEEGEEEEVIPDSTNPVVTPASSSDTSDLGEYEEDVVGFFTDKFTEELGWTFDEEEKPKTIADVIKYMNTVVEESSKPVYANEDIEKLNAFVVNGGSLKDFYKEVYNTVAVDEIDITEETAQKKVLTENFTRLGYSKDKINKFISRYEDSGTLQEEAEDALEGLKEHNTKRAEQLLVEQQNQRKEQLKTQQKFIDNVQSSVDKVDSILGIPISTKEKKELLDYIFKPEADGSTKYQKDYAKDYRNLIESAYFTMKGDSLIQKVTTKATSQATKNLQDKLANKGKRNKNSGGSTASTSSSTLAPWEQVSRHLRRPNF
jgi:hypothetical protein